MKRENSPEPHIIPDLDLKPPPTTSSANAAREQQDNKKKDLLKKLATVQTICEAEYAAHEQEILSLRLQLEEAGKKLKEVNELKAENNDIIAALRARNLGLQRELGEVAECSASSRRGSANRIRKR